jgi:hypothetical protein
VAIEVTMSNAPAATKKKLTSAASATNVPPGVKYDSTPTNMKIAPSTKCRTAQPPDDATPAAISRTPATIAIEPKSTPIASTVVQSKRKMIIETASQQTPVMMKSHQ